MPEGPPETAGFSHVGGIAIVKIAIVKNDAKKAPGTELCAYPRRLLADTFSSRRNTMGRGLLLWLIGIPIPIILIIWLLGGLHG
jgi:hypothetical protein